jgi:hypothetical protein
MVVGTASKACSADAVTDKMAIFEYLVGGVWICTVADPPENPGQIRATATYDMAPNHVIHLHVVSPDEVGDGYYGYDAQSKSYWHSGQDSAGILSWATSQEGTTYTGYSWAGTSIDAKTRSTTTYTKLDANRFIGRFVLFREGRQLSETGTCARQISR